MRRPCEFPTVAAALAAHRERQAVERDALLTANKAAFERRAAERRAQSPVPCVPKGGRCKRRGNVSDLQDMWP